MLELVEVDLLETLADLLGKVDPLLELVWVEVVLDWMDAAADFLVLGVDESWILSFLGFLGGIFGLGTSK